MRIEKGRNNRRGFSKASSSGRCPASPLSRVSGTSSSVVISGSPSEELLQNPVVAISRAEYKLENAAKAFHFDFRGKVVLDIGSSTGGFTEYALRNGAKKVVAVEKGTRQMKTPLRLDSRVELYEKTDIFTVVAGDSKKIREIKGGESLTRIEAPEVILADVSFISLTKVLLYAKKNLVKRGSKTGTEFLVMVKPQFEAEPNELNRGVVKNEKIRREIIKRFERFLRQEGFVILKKRDNELAGKSGNVERFYDLTLENKKR